MAEVIERPNGKLYRPRKVIAAAVVDGDDLLAGVMVLGTRDLGLAQQMADQYASWQLGTASTAADPVTGWWRDGFEVGHRMWVSDEVAGRAGVWFRSVEEGY